MNHQEILEKIRKEYEPYSEFAVSELQKVDKLREDWEKTKDLEWIAFRDNPKTHALVKHCASVYRNTKMQLANDDGKMTQDERMRLHISSLWALWFIRSLGGRPQDVQREVEAEITRFAEVAGISTS